MKASRRTTAAAITAGTIATTIIMVIMTTITIDHGDHHGHGRHAHGHHGHHHMHLAALAMLFALKAYRRQHALARPAAEQGIRMRGHHHHRRRPHGEEPEAGERATTRVQLEMPPQAMERLQKLKDRSEAASYAEVIRNALRLYRSAGGRA